MREVFSIDGVDHCALCGYDEVHCDCANDADLGGVIVFNGPGRVVLDPETGEFSREYEVCASCGYLYHSYDCPELEASSAALTRIVRQRIADGASQFQARATYLRAGKAVTVTATIDLGKATWLTRVELSDYRAYDRPSDRVTAHIVDALVDSVASLRTVVLAARNRDYA